MKTLDEILQEKEYSITGGIIEAFPIWLCVRHGFKYLIDGLKTCLRSGLVKI